MIGELQTGDNRTFVEKLADIIICVDNSHIE